MRGRCATTQRRGKISASVNLTGAVGPAQSARSAKQKAVRVDLLLPPSPTVHAGELKQATVLFSDLVGSTALIRGLDAEEGVALLDSAINRMVLAVSAFQGRVFRIHGDGILALFGAPIAQEDHAEQACASALAIRDACDEAHMRVRIGLDSGEVVIRTNSAANFDVGGLTVHLAARMERVAKPGIICLTANTMRLVQHRFSTHQLAQVRCKGIRGTVKVFELVARNSEKSRWEARVSRGLSAFVGRPRELDAIRQRLLSSARGIGEVVVIEGHAGTGKSRLVYEVTRLKELFDWNVIIITPEPADQRTGLLAVTKMLRAQLRISAQASAEEIRKRLAGWLVPAGPMSEIELAALQALLDVQVPSRAWTSLDVENRRAATIKALRSVLLRFARHKPLFAE